MEVETATLKRRCINVFRMSCAGKLGSHYPAGKNRKKVNTLEEWVFVESAFKMQCFMHKKTLLRTAFSTIFQLNEY